MLLYFLFSAASAQTEAQIKCPKHDMGIVMKYASCAVDPDCFVNPAGLCEAYPTKVVCHNYGVVDTCDDPPKYCSDCDCTLWGGCVAVSETQSPTPSTESPTMTPTAKPTIATVTSIPVPDVWGGACCKVCTIGKACGDSCISTGSVCKLSTGCACNAPPSTCETSTTWEDPWSYNCDYYSTDHMEVHNLVPAWCKDGYITHQQYVGYGAEENCCNCRFGLLPPSVSDPTVPALDPLAPPAVPICSKCTSYATFDDTNKAGSADPACVVSGGSTVGRHGGCLGHPVSYNSYGAVVPPPVPPVIDTTKAISTISKETTSKMSAVGRRRRLRFDARRHLLQTKVTAGISTTTAEEIIYNDALNTAIDQQLSYCQDINGRCWSNLDFGDRCGSYPGQMCMLGVDWTVPENQCTRKVDIMIFVDESPSVQDYQWNEAARWIRAYIIALNGGPDGLLIGNVDSKMKDVFRISIIQFSGSGEQAAALKFESCLEGLAQCLKEFDANMFRRFGTKPQSCPSNACHAAAKGLMGTDAGARVGANGAATIGIMLIDGNPSPANDCSLTDEQRIANIDFFKEAVDVMIPIGIGSFVDVGTLITLSKGMPAKMPYVTASFGSLSSAFDNVMALTCVPVATTGTPTAVPTLKPTTMMPTAAPTAVFGCNAEEKAVCGIPGNVNGACSCADEKCSAKRCTCKNKSMCGNAACSICTMAPTNSPTLKPTNKPTLAPSAKPTSAPSKAPTTIPTVAPSFSTQCNGAQTGTCDAAQGTCSVDNGGVAPTVHCACKTGYGCTTTACNECTAAPTTAPTSPSLAPTMPTVAPSNAPSSMPTSLPSGVPTFLPTSMPTFAFGCSDLERETCDAAQGTCFCKDAVCSAKKCGCNSGFGCGNGPCTICTARPTSAPTTVPSMGPTASPTDGPTNYALFASGEVSAQDFEALSNEQKIAGAAALSGIVIVLLILGIIAAILIILAILATTTGIFLYKHTQDVSTHTFEGELVSGKSIPVGTECAAPAWAVEAGGDGVNPLGNHRDLSRVHSFFSSLKKTFSTASLTTNPAAAMRGEGTELQPTSSFFGKLKMTFSSASLTSNPMETLQEVEMEEADVRAFDAQTDLGLGVEAAHAAPTKSGSIVYDAGI